MKIQEIIKGKLAKHGFDKNEILVEKIETMVTSALEEKAEKMVTTRVIKRAIADMLAPTPRSTDSQQDEK